MYIQTNNGLMTFHVFNQVSKKKNHFPIGSHVTTFLYLMADILEFLLTQQTNICCEDLLWMAEL